MLSERDWRVPVAWKYSLAAFLSTDSKLFIHFSMLALNSKPFRQKNSCNYFKVSVDCLGKKLVYSAVRSNIFDAEWSTCREYFVRPKYTPLYSTGGLATANINGVGRFGRRRQKRRDTESTWGPPVVRRLRLSTWIISRRSCLSLITSAMCFAINAQVGCGRASKRRFRFDATLLHSSHNRLLDQFLIVEQIFSYTSLRSRSRAPKSSRLNSFLLICSIIWSA